MSKKRLVSKERRIQILQCAVKVFARSNYQAARIADIAAEAGISDATIYKHFPSKKSIFLEILNHMQKRIMTLWQEEFHKEEDAKKLLKKMGIIYFTRMINHPEALKVHFQAVSEINDKDIAKKLKNDHRSYVEFIKKVLRKGIRQGKFRKDLDIHTLAWHFNGIGIMMNMIKLLSFKEEFSEKKISKIMDFMIEAIKT